ncbi:hypothetical protein [Magnetospirillum fulvum]|uniref:Uncharacterized protein n=1 Tax=Magnetospirillum fulvum MGU-K5 TaxID=1316936 RepID=S9TUN1_MAGFU|nr:hypothetical protein [Magnetospirillum fulvum]EPY02180.1 hypothetical protein K678_07373 [Magnetospirillum fulvum MGU-K5]
MTTSAKKLAIGMTPGISEGYTAGQRPLIRPARIIDTVWAEIETPLPARIEPPLAAIIAAITETVARCYDLLDEKLLDASAEENFGGDMWRRYRFVEAADAAWAAARWTRDNHFGSMGALHLEEIYRMAPAALAGWTAALAQIGHELNAFRSKPHPRPVEANALLRRAQALSQEL